MSNQDYSLLYAQCENQVFIIIGTLASFFGLVCFIIGVLLSLGILVRKRSKVVSPRPAADAENGMNNNGNTTNNIPLQTLSSGQENRDLYRSRNGGQSQQGLQNQSEGHRLDDGRSEIGGHSQDFFPIRAANHGRNSHSRREHPGKQSSARTPISGNEHPASDRKQDLDGLPGLARRPVGQRSYSQYAQAESTSQDLGTNQTPCSGRQSHNGADRMGGLRKQEGGHSQVHGHSHAEHYGSPYGVRSGSRGQGGLGFDDNASQGSWR